MAELVAAGAVGVIVAAAVWYAGERIIRGWERLP